MIGKNLVLLLIQESGKTEFKIMKMEGQTMGNMAADNAAGKRNNSLLDAGSFVEIG